MARSLNVASVVVASALASGSANPGPVLHSRSIAAASPHLRHRSNSLAPSFEANLGQINDEVQFTLRSRDYTIFLTRLEAALVLKENRLHEQTTSTKRRVTGRASMTENRYLPNANTQHVVRMRYVGANPQPTIRGCGRVSR